MSCADRLATGWAFAGLIPLLFAGCGGDALDLGANASPAPDNAAWYRGPDTSPGAGAGSELIVKEQRISALAADDSHLFWVAGVQSGSVKGCAVSDCAATLTEYARGDDGRSVALASNGTDLYWSFTARPDTGVWTCPVTGCLGEPKRISPDSGMSLLTDSTHVYWHDQSWPPRVLRCPRSGCPAGPESLGSFDGIIRGLALRDADLYVAIRYPTATGYAGRIVAISTKDARQRIVADGLPTCGAIAASGTEVFWLETDAWTTASPRLASCPNAGGVDPFRIVAQGDALGQGQWLLLDDAKLYWGSGDNLVACPTSGCSVPQVVTPCRASTAAVLQGQFIYYAAGLDPGNSPPGALDEIRRWWR
jgi:hypothetical protein